ncbi:MAG: hypothetical protein C0621_06585 [Desulfuromonas sp.]|nr:MAG: hypothetical protein C0621_06585 [Desulfuromonas sp.]
MSIPFPCEFSNVTVSTKASVYFDGKVVSHAFTLADGSRKSLGVIFPGTYTFNTAAPERMEIVAGSCRVRIADASDWQMVDAGSFFDIPKDSSFEISVEEGTVEYICSYN